MNEVYIFFVKSIFGLFFSRLLWVLKECNKMLSVR